MNQYFKRQLMKLTACQSLLLAEKCTKLYKTQYVKIYMNQYFEKTINEINGVSITFIGRKMH